MGQVSFAPQIDISRIDVTPSRQSAAPSPPLVPHWTNELSTYGEGFAGREDELNSLDAAWNSAATRVFALHAEGGAGKTRVLVQWLNRLRDDGWRGAGGVFVHSFYSQGTDERRNASSEAFFEKALAYLAYQGEPIKDPKTRGETLARLVVEHQALLVLDGLEPLQHPRSFNEGRLRDPSIEHLLLSLSLATGGTPRPALCVVTSRQPVIELRPREGRTVVQRHLERLDRAAGASLLSQLEVRGTQRELSEAVDEYHGHAYSLMLLGSYLRDATTDHDIRRRHEIPLLEEDREHQSHAGKLFGSYLLHLGEISPEAIVLYLLGLFDRSAERQLLDVLREAKADDLDPFTRPLHDLSPANWNRLLSRLRNLRLISFNHGSDAIDSHPLLREFFHQRLQEKQSDAWRAAHRRLYGHLCTTTSDRKPEPTLEDLQPLYQAIAHGCQAGMQQEAREQVYRDRILRGTGSNGFYSTRKLGAFGSDLSAVACFFDQPWSRISPALAEAAQAWLLNQAAICLHALGRLTEALQPLRAALEINAAKSNWKNATASAGNLSELELTLGDVPAAVEDAAKSVTYADQSNDGFLRMGMRARHADPLHQAGCPDQALALFRIAERMQHERQPQYPLLYSLQGFLYCDILLNVPERAAWQSLLNPKSQIPNPELAQDCRVVTERVTQTLKESEAWPDTPLLDFALDHLTLGRAALYEEILNKSEIRDLNSEIDRAVNGFRRAGTTNHIPRALLTRAWLRKLMNDPTGAQTDLDEAWDIAERGPMRLHMADIHLYRARLFFHEPIYPWNKNEDGSPRTPADDLAAARALIEKCGYLRRLPELKDAESAILKSPRHSASD